MSAMTTQLSHANLGETFIDGLDWAELMDTATDVPTDAQKDAQCAYPIHSTRNGGDAGPACPLLHLGDELSLDFDLVEFIDPAPGAPVLPPLPLQTPAGKPQQHRQQPNTQSNASSFSSDADSGMEADTDSGSESTASSSPPSPPGDHGLDGWIATLSAGAGQNRAYTVASAPKAGKASNASKASKGLREAAPGPMHRTSESLVASITLRERALLEGKAVAVPTVKDLPLTKAEESRLRASLRKIRNKDSAIRSRKKKEVYVAGLEVRVEECARANVALSSKVTSLEQTNLSLLEQLNGLRRQISLMPNAGGTVVMMVIVCCGIQLAPDSLAASSSLSSAGPGSSQAPAPGFRSRTLKSVHPDLEPAGAWAEDVDGFVVVAIARWAAAFAVIAAVWFLARRGGRKLLKNA